MASIHLNKCLSMMLDEWIYYLYKIARDGSDMPHDFAQILDSCSSNHNILLTPDALNLMQVSVFAKVSEQKEKVVHGEMV